MTIKKKLVKQGRMVRNNPANHGADVVGSWLYPGLEVHILVDVEGVWGGKYGSPHDGWVPLVGPPELVDDKGYYLNYGVRAWYPLDCMSEVTTDTREYLTVIDAKTDEVISCVRVK